ncbi:hypothetical protein JXQ31_09295 [candidate division KSB1 bacterium]|nr:hypothetical protein [candidate division KSB1 bacterium]
MDSTDFVIFMDAGGFGRGGGEIAQLYTNYLVNGLSKIGYRIFNLSYRDFFNGGEFIRGLAKKYDVDFVASNTYYKDTNNHFTDPFLVKTIKANKNAKSIPFNKIKIGIIGACDEYGMLFSKQLDEQMLESKPPLGELQKNIEKVREKSDMVVFLFNGNYKTFKEITGQVKGIDVAVMGGQYYMVTPNEFYNNTIVVTTPSMGKYVGQLTVELDKDKKIVSHSVHQEALKEDMKDDPDMVKLVQEFEQAEKKLQDSQIYGTE